MPKYRAGSSSPAPSPQSRNMALWLKYIAAIPWAPGELDCQEFCAFSKAAHYGIDQDTAFNIVVAKMQACEAGTLRLAKIKHSLKQAYGNSGEGLLTQPPLRLPSVEPYSEERLRAEIGDFKADENFFIERSPYITWNRSPAGVLHKLTAPGESVWVTGNEFSPDGCIWRNDGNDRCSAKWISVTGDNSGPKEFRLNFECLSYFANGCDGVWFLNNPNSGQPHHDARLAHGHSYRCLETVTAWRYLVLETDIAPTDLWLALLAAAPLRIAAIYHSGGRGHHALVRIDAASKFEADDLVEVFKREYVPLGACKGTLSAFRLTRLPNCHRNETGRLQRLIYLDSNPTDIPIKEQPILRKLH